MILDKNGQPYNNEQLQELEAIKNILEGNTVIDYDKLNGWLGANDSTEELKLDQVEQEDLRRMARKRFYQNPHGKAIIRAIKTYIIGQGIELTWPDGSTSEQELYEDYREDPENQCRLRDKELIEETLIDGEVFRHYLPHKDFSKNYPIVRHIPPETINDPTNTHSDGIELDPNDAETPVAYFRMINTIQAEVIPASEIQHVKINCRRNQKRGRSELEPILNAIGRHDNWVKDRATLSAIRNKIALIKQVKGGQVNALSGTTSTGSSTNTNENKQYKPGTIFTASPSVEYNMLSPNLQATDAQHDGRMLQLLMTIGGNIPEFIFDPSNANYSSSLVSESPFVKHIMDWQDFFEEVFREEIRRVLVYSGTPEDKALDLVNEIGMEWPTIVHRDWSEEAKTWKELSEPGASGEPIASIDTVRMKVGLDPDQEQEQIDQQEKDQRNRYGDERQFDLERMLTMARSGGNGDGEDDADFSR